MIEQIYLTNLEFKIWSEHILYKYAQKRTLTYTSFLREFSKHYYVSGALLNTDKEQLILQGQNHHSIITAAKIYYSYRPVNHSVTLTKWRLANDWRFNKFNLQDYYRMYYRLGLYGNKELVEQERISEVRNWCQVLGIPFRHSNRKLGKECTDEELYEMKPKGRAPRKSWKHLSKRNRQHK